MLAEFERDQISERTASAMQHKKSKKELVGAIPYGFDLADDGVNLVENEVEQDVIQQARDLHTGGMSLRKVAAELQRRGFSARNGGLFQATQISRMVA